jgi:hypothetical protein
MAIDFLTSLPPTGNGRGRPAYHDKRFVLQTALQHFDTAIFVDADTRIRTLPRLPNFSPGIAVPGELQTNIAAHLRRWGSARIPAFEQLTCVLTTDINLMERAKWCGEWLFAITKDGSESKFFETWAFAAEFLRARNVLTGEGGVIGIAAAVAGWRVDYRALSKLEAVFQHEGHGPKTV